MSGQCRCSYGCGYRARFQVGDNILACARHLAFYVKAATSRGTGNQWVKVAQS